LGIALAAEFFLAGGQGFRGKGVLCHGRDEDDQEPAKAIRKNEPNLAPFHSGKRYHRERGLQRRRTLNYLNRG
jgi:hypothetical protein